MAMSRRLSEMLARLRALVLSTPAPVLALSPIEQECEFFRPVM